MFLLHSDEIMGPKEFEDNYKAYKSRATKMTHNFSVEA